MIQKHGTPASVRHLAPGLFVASILISGITATISSTVGAVFGIYWARAFGCWSGITMAGVLIAYLLVVLVGSVQTAKKSGWPLLPILPFVFATYHIGYGLGFLEGVLDFVLLRRAPQRSKGRITR